MAVGSQESCLQQPVNSAGTLAATRKDRGMAGHKIAHDEGGADEGGAVDAPRGTEEQSSSRPDASFLVAA